MDGWWNQKWCDNLADWGKTWDPFDAADSGDLKPVLYTLDFLVGLIRLPFLIVELPLRAIHSYTWKDKTDNPDAVEASTKRLGTSILSSYNLNEIKDVSSLKVGDTVLVNGTQRTVQFDINKGPANLPMAIDDLYIDRDRLFQIKNWGTGNVASPTHWIKDGNYDIRIKGEQIFPKE